MVYNIGSFFFKVWFFGNMGLFRVGGGIFRSRGRKRDIELI